MLILQSFVHCRKPGQLSLKQAMLNVDKYYSVVGILENTDTFYKLLEKQLPQFFFSAHSVYKSIGKFCREINFILWFDIG